MRLKKNRANGTHQGSHDAESIVDAALRLVQHQTVGTSHEHSHGHTRCWHARHLDDLSCHQNMHTKNAHRKVGTTAVEHPAFCIYNMGQGVKTEEVSVMTHVNHVALSNLEVRGVGATKTRLRAITVVLERAKVNKLGGQSLEDTIVS